MKKSPLKRGTSQLKRTALIRGTPLKKKNVRRAKQRFADAYGDKAWWIRGLRCVVGGCGSFELQAAHVKSRAAGGTSADLVPICNLHHAEQHIGGIRSFEQRHNVNLARIAATLEERWQQQREAA